MNCDICRGEDDQHESWCPEGDGSTDYEDGGDFARNGTERDLTKGEGDEE